MKFRAKVDVVESMGSELYVYFDVESQGMDSDELSELAADSGMEDLPSHGDGQQIVARLSSESKASPGGEVELSLDLSHAQAVRGRRRPQPDRCGRARRLVAALRPVTGSRLGRGRRGAGARACGAGSRRP